MKEKAILKENFSLNTKRLVIRFLKKSDYRNWVKAESSTSKKKNRWDHNPVPVDNEEKLKEHFKKRLEFIKNERKDDKGYFFTAFEKKSGNFIGTVSLMDISRAIFQNAYIGYRVLNPYWGKGYGKEMVKGAVKIAFKDLKLHRVEAGIEPGNIRSIRLAKTLGFRKEGLSKRRLLVKKKWTDILIYAITKDEVL